MYQLEDIESVEDIGFCNMIDFSVEGDSTFLLANGIVSHNSALAGLIGPLGRERCGFYTLKGKPLNAYSASSSKFTTNKELSELYQIINSDKTEVEAKAGDFYEITVNGKKGKLEYFTIK